jgi:hypothetical protein
MLKNLLNSMTGATPSMRFVLLRWYISYGAQVIVPKQNESWLQIGVSKTTFNRSLNYLVNEGYINSLKPSHLYNSSSAPTYRLSQATVNLQLASQINSEVLELFEAWLVKPLQLNESLNTRILVLASILLQEPYIDLTRHLSVLKVLTGMDTNSIKKNASKALKLSGVFAPRPYRGCGLFAKSPFIYCINQFNENIQVTHLGLPLPPSFIFENQLFSPDMYSSANLFMLLTSNSKNVKKAFYGGPIEPDLRSMSAFCHAAINHHTLRPHLISLFHFIIRLFTVPHYKDQPKSLKEIVEFLKLYLPVKARNGEPSILDDKEPTSFEAFNKWATNKANLAVVDEFYTRLASNISDQLIEIITQLAFFKKKYNSTIIDIVYCPTKYLIAQKRLSNIDTNLDILDKDKSSKVNEAGDFYFSNAIFEIASQSNQSLPRLALVVYNELIDDDSLVLGDKKNSFQ